MKISASIYSNKESPLEEIIKELDEHQIDFFHVDCDDNLNVFNDIELIRRYSSKPVDLHIISDTPEKYFDLLEKHKVEYVAFQHENLKSVLKIPDNVKSNCGLAITSDTDISVFDPYADKFSFILFMATIPGKSAGIFNKENFGRIRKFRSSYPDKKIHVDGGVNGEVSFILRNMGVNVAVSGSYLFNSNHLGSALLNLKSNDIDSRFLVKDFMRTTDESPVLYPDKRQLIDVLNSIDEYQLAFTVLVNEECKLDGIISNADVRKGLIRNINDLNGLKVEEIVNANPVTINENNNVLEMLRHVKSQKFPVSYLPVINDENIFTGVVTFNNLIKGEL